MRKSIVAGALFALTILMLAGCTSKNTAPVAKAAEPVAEKTEVPQIVTAKTAFWPMYKAAHEWAPDVVVIRLTAKSVPGYTNEAGKAGMWEAVFGSPSRHQYRLFTYSIIDHLPEIHKGVAAERAMPWAGETRDAMAIDTTQFNVDSDTAYQTAATNAADWLKKNPKKELASLEMGQTYHFQGPVWYVLWGDKKAGYNALIDGSNGKSLIRK